MPDLVEFWMAMLGTSGEAIRLNDVLHHYEGSGSIPAIRS
jgi:hypothetical protein